MSLYVASAITEQRSIELVYIVAIDDIEVQSCKLSALVDA